MASASQNSTGNSTDRSSISSNPAGRSPVTPGSSVSNSATPSPKVSIIVPVYNVERYLRQCLDSVRAQTLSDFEAILVDDGSTDGSGLIAQEYAARDSRFRVISQENAGLSAARNAGLDSAAGEYVAFLDSDDWIEPDMMAKTVAAADRTGAQIVIFDYWLYHDTTGKLGTYRDQEIYARLDGTAFTLEERPEMAQFIGVWDRIFRRDFIEEHGFRYPVGRIYEDVTFCVETEVAAKRIALLADHLYYYRRDVATSITGGEATSTKHKDDFLYVQGYAQERFREAGVSDEVWKHYARYFMEYCIVHQRQTRPPYYRKFFEGVRALACPRLVEMGQRRRDPELRLYRYCLKKDWPTFTLIWMKILNQGHNLVRVVRWQVEKRSAARHGE